MSYVRSATLGLIATLALLVSASVFAHPKLIASKPADNAVVSTPATIELSFSESLMPQLSSVDVTMTQMPGMTMEPMKVAVKAAPSADAKSLILTPVRPLEPGTYRVDWHVVSTDTHAVKGSFTFRVK